MFPFGAMFREVAERETRVLTTSNHPRLGSESYALVEVYCTEPDCDCRRLLINVVRDSDMEHVATVSWAFDPKAPDRGPFLDPLNPQSDLSPALLDLVGRLLASDRAYVDRLERHYRMVKESVADPDHDVHRILRGERNAGSRPPSRNAPCRCGSGKKYKRCCGGTATAAPSADPVMALRTRIAEFGQPKYADRPPGEFAERVAREFPDAGAMLARVMAYELDGLLRRNAQTLLFVACQEAGIAPPLRDKVVHTAAPVLRAAMKDPTVPDDRKFHLGPLLEACGAKLTRKEYQESFRDFDGTADRMNAEHLGQMSADPETLEAALEAAGLVSTDCPARPSKRRLGKAFILAGTATEHNPDMGAMLLSTVAAIAVEHGKALDEAEAALLLTRRLANARGAWALEELGRWPGLDRLGKKARTLADELRAEGVQSHAPYSGTFSHAWATGVDGVGSRNLFVFFRTPSGTMDALVLMPNDDVGLKDVWCAFDSGADMEKDYLGQHDEIRTAPVSLELACELVGDALSTHDGRGVPPPGRFLLYRPMLGPKPLPIRKRAPNLGAYALEILPRSPQLVDRSESLADSPLWREHWCATDEAYDFVRRNARGKRHRAGATWIGERFLELFLNAVVVRDRERLLRRMAVNLETESWAGRAGELQNRLAARTYVAISEQLLPFDRIPLVRVLGRRALDNVSANVAMGFRSQREANEAAMP